MRVDNIARAGGFAGLGAGGWWLGVWIGNTFNFNGGLALGVESGTLAVGALLGLAITPYLTTRPFLALAEFLATAPVITFVAIIVGLVLGLATAALLAVTFSHIPGIAGIIIPILLSVVLACLGIYVLMRRQDDIAQFLPEPRAGQWSKTPRDYKVLLDTSAIIDGRIADVTESGFLTGTLVIPRFILDELRHIADSTDSMRRNRGRRGLEILNKLRKDSEVPIQVLDVDMRDGQEADEKLVVLARSMRAPIATTDYNLNRVAELQGVRVLNVNELANALKPVVLPGENMRVRVIQEGKEAGQGVGFLDDGTMVVVEGGRRHINTHLDTVVTRVLQTAAGRIIFAQPKEDH